MKTRVVEIRVTGAGKDYAATVQRMIEKTKEFKTRQRHPYGKAARAGSFYGHQ